MMNENKQSGKGLAGFFVGLLLATAVIAGVLFFLNKSNKAAIKTASQPQVQEKQKSWCRAPVLLFPIRLHQKHLI